MAEYWQGAGGDDGNAGTSWGARFATIQKLLDTGEPGDTLYLQGETVATRIDNDMNGGGTASPTIGNPIYVRGCDSSGNALNGAGQAIILASASMTHLVYLTNADYFFWYDIKFDGGGSGKADISFGTNLTYDSDGVCFYNCRFTNATTHCIVTKCSITWALNFCEVDNAGKGGATGSGIYGPAAGQRNSVSLNNCSVHDNLQHGIFTSRSNTLYLSTTLVNCLVYKNGGCGVLLNSASGPTAFFVSGCTFYGNGSHHISVASSSVVFYVYGMFNNIFSSSGGYAYYNYGGAVSYLNPSQWANNCFYNNTSGNIDVLGGTPPGIGNVYTDPLFKSTTAGSEDFTLQAGSPCKGTSIKPVGYSSAGGDIGAIQSLAGGASTSGRQARMRYHNV